MRAKAASEPPPRPPRLLIGAEPHDFQAHTDEGGGRVASLCKPLFKFDGMEERVSRIQVPLMTEMRAKWQRMVIKKRKAFARTGAKWTAIS